jgi:hypothetical protein
VYLPATAGSRMMSKFSAFCRSAAVVMQEARRDLEGK